MRCSSVFGLKLLDETKRFEWKKTNATLLQSHEQIKCRWFSSIQPFCNVKLKSKQQSCQVTNQPEACDWVRLTNWSDSRPFVGYSFDKFRSKFFPTRFSIVFIRLRYMYVLKRDRGIHTNTLTFRSGISFLWNQTSSISSWFDSVEIVIGSV